MLKDAFLGLLVELGRLWRTALAAAIVFGLFAILYVWAVGVDISVRNESTGDLSSVQLVWYTHEGDQGLLWTQDLEPKEGEWRYVFNSGLGVAVQFDAHGRTVRQGCDFDSKGIGRSVEFRILSDRTILCESTARRS